jgi:hypothetical protein
LDVDGCVQAPGYCSLDADYVLWGVRPRKTTPVAVASNFLPGATAGTTIDTLGEEHVDNHLLSGARFAVGYWWTENNPWLPGSELPVMGVETRFFFLADRSFNFVDNQSPTLGRPFFDTSTSTQSAVIIASPGVATGRITGSATAKFWGAEANLWKNIYYDTPGSTPTLEAMVGFRFLDRDTGANLSRFSQFLPGLPGNLAFLSGNVIGESESFMAHNHFYGTQIGIRGRCYLADAMMVLSGEFGLGLGATNEVINIQGSQTRTTPAGSTIISQGALLALPGNIGRFSEWRFAQVPEGTLTLGFPVTDRLTLSLGFTALYWSRTVRAGDQLSTQIDARTIPSFPAPGPSIGSPSVGVPFQQTDLWLVGSFLSAEFKW